jgi:hypothetical protein
MTVARASGDRIRLTSRSGRFFIPATRAVGRPAEGPARPTPDRGICAISEAMVPQIPYSAIGIGIAVIFGVWAFVVAETAKERAIIAVAAMLIFLAGSIFRSMAGQLVALFGWVVYGIGCVIFLRFNGLEIR